MNDRVSLWQKWTIAAVTTLSTLLPSNSQVQAATFEQQEITNPDAFALIAAPIGRTNRYQLLIVEQLSNRRACWSESDGYPTAIEPLLLNFDFTGICGRMSDANAYSVRVAGEDLGVKYALRIRQRSDNMILVASPIRRDLGLPELEVGRAHGVGNGFTKIYLDPAWRLGRRVFQGRTLGHIYLMSDYSITELAEFDGQDPTMLGQTPIAPGTGNPTVTPMPSPSSTPAATTTPATPATTRPRPTVTNPNEPIAKARFKF